MSLRPVRPSSPTTTIASSRTPTQADTGVRQFPYGTVPQPTTPPPASIAIAIAAAPVPSSWSWSGVVQHLVWPAWKLTSTHQNSDAQRGENRRLRFRDTLFSLLEQAEREHRAKTPRIRMQGGRHAEPEDDIYRQFEDFEIEAEVDGQSTVVHVRTDYKFGPWEAGTGPWAWHGERREGFFFEPNHSLSDFLKGVKSEGVKSEDVRRLRRREITIGSTAVEHLIPPMTITDEVLGPQETGSESRSAYVAKYGTAPTVTLSLTVQRPLRLESKQAGSTGHEVEQTQRTTRLNPH